jgi:hypothetical protein
VETGISTAVLQPLRERTNSGDRSAFFQQGAGGVQVKRYGHGRTRNKLPVLRRCRMDEEMLRYRYEWTKEKRDVLVVEVLYKQ